MKICTILDRNTSDEVDIHQRVCLHAEVLTSIFGNVCEAGCFVSLITGQAFSWGLTNYMYVSGS